MAARARSRPRRHSGHPDRTADEIREWAYEHELPYFDDEVHFPDARIEYEKPDGRWLDVMHAGRRWRMPVDDFAIPRGATERAGDCAVRTVIVCGGGGRALPFGSLRSLRALAITGGSPRASVAFVCSRQAS